MSAAGRAALVRQVLSVGLLGLLAVGVLRVACSARLERADFVFNNGAEVGSFDPALVTGIAEGRVLRHVFEGLLVKHPRTLELLPGMAEDWSVSPDGRVYRFAIRRGARWSNGDPVTADDFVFSWERVLNPATATRYAYLLYPVVGARAYNTQVDEAGRPLHDFARTVGIRALDAHTLEVELAAPTAYFPQLMAFQTTLPVNRRSLEGARERWPEGWEIQWLRPENLVSNGPYRVLERRVNDRIRLVKDPGYWDAERVAFETVDILAVESSGTMLNLYLQGEVDWIDRVAPGIVPRLRGREDWRPRPYLGSYFYRINVTRPPFDDARLRRALALTIERRAIVLMLLRSGEAPAWSLVPPMEGYAPAEMEHGPDFAADCAAARELLAAAGFGPGGRALPTVEIHYNTSEQHRDVAEVIADSWRRELGLEVVLQSQEFKVYLDTQSQLGYDISRSVWTADFLDPLSFLELWVTGGENNRTGWGSAEYDALIGAARVELDPARRAELLGRAEALLMAELPVLPIHFYVTRNLVNPRLGGFHQNLLDEHWPKFLYWMDDEELAGRRADLPAGTRLVPAPGPAGGLYSPAQRRARERGR